MSDPYDYVLDERRDREESGDVTVICECDACGRDFEAPARLDSVDRSGYRGPATPLRSVCNECEFMEKYQP